MIGQLRLGTMRSNRKQKPVEEYEFSAYSSQTMILSAISRPGNCMTNTQNLSMILSASSRFHTTDGHHHKLSILEISFVSYDVNVSHLNHQTLALECLACKRGESTCSRLIISPIVQLYTSVLNSRQQPLRKPYSHIATSRVAHAAVTPAHVFYECLEN